MADDADQQPVIQGQRAALALGFEATRSHRELAANVASVRYSQRRTTEQTAYRTEMAFVQARNDLRRAMWWSFAAYTTCLLAALSVASLFARPVVLVYWRGITIALATLATILVLMGIKRDGGHARNSWTRLRFAPPVENI